MARWIIAFTFLFGLFSSCGATEIRFDCDAPELVEGNAKYNQLVCNGVGFMTRNRYAEAAKTFEMAMEVPLFEMPNFELFPRLALAHFMAGNREKAMENLKKAELSLSVLTGILHCLETEQGLFVVRENGERIDDFGISRKMCGAAYDYFYRRFSLEQVLQEAELVKRYFDIKNRIRGIDEIVE
ncbi:MAG: hypothetical protein KJO08_07405 [Gammaproteobacteria bacterium]|nr:hypothetical protein [Gammaproteobacteria bacterium]